MFYVYEWSVKETGEIFYVGKGSGNRYKSTTKRNKLFKLYYENFNCDTKIIKEFENEIDAFTFEHERIMELKAINQAKCNLDYGGKGGCHFSWTNEMRDYKSKYNPMKAYNQRERMSKNNPMKNKEIALKVGSKNSRAVIIDNNYIKSVKSASIYYGVTEYTIITWCKRGYNTEGKPCRYANEEQKEYSLMKLTHPKTKTYKSVLVDGILFDTVKDAANYIGVWSENLIKAIKNNRKCKGHTCRYDNQQPSTNLNG